MLVEFEKKNLTGGIFFKLEAKNYFGIEKISFFGNYIDPCILEVVSWEIVTWEVFHGKMPLGKYPTPFLR